MQLDKDTRREIRQLLIPHVQSAAERDALVREAFYGSPLISNIAGDGKNAFSYASHLIDECIKFGELESGEHSIIALLTEIQLRVGSETQKQIDHLKSNLLSVVASANLPDTSEIKFTSEGSTHGLSAQDYFTLGKEHIKNKRWHHAIEMYSHGIKLAPNTSSAYSNRAAAHYNLDQLEEALADYTEAIRLSPDKAAYYHNRAAVYGALKLHRKAIVEYNEAIRLGRTDADTYAGRGQAYYFLNQRAKAIADLQHALDINPHNFTAKQILNMIRRNPNPSPKQKRWWQF